MREQLKRGVTEDERETIEELMASARGRVEAALSPEICTMLAVVVRDQAHQIERSHDELVDQGRQHQHDLEQVRADLVGQLNIARATLQKVQQELERRLIEQVGQVDQVCRDLIQQQEALVTLRRDMTTLVEQQVHEVLTALEQLSRDQAQDVAQLRERLGKIEQRIEQVATQTEAVQTAALGYQKRADGQESRL